MFLKIHSYKSLSFIRVSLEIGEVKFKGFRRGELRVFGGGGWNLLIG